MKTASAASRRAGDLRRKLMGGPQPKPRPVVSIPQPEPSKSLLPLLDNDGCPSLWLILRETCRGFGVTRDDMRSVRRPDRLTHPRQAFFHLARVMTRQSWERISAVVDKDRTTAIHAHEKIQKLRSGAESVRDAGLLETVERVRTQIEMQTRKPYVADDVD